VCVYVVGGLGEQRDELGLVSRNGKLPHTVEVPDGVEFGVPQRLLVVFLVSGDDIPVEPA
jgi:hypothetical protein